MNILISGSLNSDDFDIVGGVIIPSDKCFVNFAVLPINVQMVLYNYELVISFLLNLEKEKLDNLKKASNVNSIVKVRK